MFDILMSIALSWGGSGGHCPLPIPSSDAYECTTENLI